MSRARRSPRTVLETMQQIAALAKSLPRDEEYSRIGVSLGPSNAATLALLEMPGARASTTVYAADRWRAEAHSVDLCTVTVDGVDFHAHCDPRTPTDEERAGLAAMPEGKNYHVKVNA